MYKKKTDNEIEQLKDEHLKECCIDLDWSSGQERSKQISIVNNYLGNDQIEDRLSLPNKFKPSLQSRGLQKKDRHL